MVRITFIWHDCFVVETDRANFIFDYWLDQNGNPSEFPAFLNSLDRSKPLMVLVSHGHKDHFNTAIFGWARDFDNIHYVVSKDVGRRIRHIISETSVYSGPKVDSSQVSVLKNGESLDWHDIKVRAFPSTDIGNSYLVETDDKKIFHAGDLNAWIWLDESTDAEVRKAMGDYKACLRDIEEYLGQGNSDTPQGDGRIDFCFFPVDSRIGTDYFTGAEIFVNKFDVGHFFPMHFDLGEAEERARRRKDALDFNNYANFKRGEYIPLAVNGSYWISAG